jgi:hypothetical protein
MRLKLRASRSLRVEKVAAERFDDLTGGFLEFGRASRRVRESVPSKWKEFRC